MNPNLQLLEQLQIVSGIVPINLAAGANTGDVVSLKGYRRCLVVLFAGAGNNDDDPILQIDQGTDVAFGTNKALNFETIYTKQGTLTSVGQWTEVTQSANNTYTSATGGETEQIWAVDIKAEDLDIANDYDCIRASVADVGSVSKIGGLLYLLYDPVQMAAPASMASAIVD